MRKYAFLLIPLLFVLFCQRGKSDEDIIRDLLENSFFASEAVMGGIDDETTTPRRFSLLLSDTLPEEIKFARKIDRPIEREWNINVIGDSAYAIGDADSITGGFYLINELGLWEKSIYDQAHREVVFKKIDGRWRFYAITPIEFWTKDKKDYITIEKIEITASPSGNSFEIDDPLEFFKKEELPWFEPADTVHVKVTVKVVGGDSCWAFLHHGRGYRKGVGKHHRDPFYRTSVEDSIYVFERDWYISDDIEKYEKPVVRHGAVDVIAGSTLYGDTTYSYIAHAYALPYIIKHVGEELPGDTEE